MPVFRSILVPTDLSACSERARDAAFALAEHAEAVHLLYVDGPTASFEHAHAVRARLREFGAGSPVPPIVAFRRGMEVTDAVLRYARRQKVDLIVMGTHHGSGLTGMLLGSTTGELVRHAPCPVLTVRHDDEHDGPMLTGGPILVPIDFSEASRAALRWASRLAAERQTRLDLLHVVPERFRPNGFASGAATRGWATAYEEDWLDDALRALMVEPGVASCHLGLVRVLTGARVPAIVHEATRLGSDLVVLGTRGLRGLDHLVVGSVTESVVRTAPCPVLAVKAPPVKEQPAVPLTLTQPFDGLSGIYPVLK